MVNLYYYISFIILEIFCYEINLFYRSKRYFFPNFRDGNVFDVRANIAPGETVIYRLTYEQLLKRKLSMYEHKININPKYEH